jgi:hypothetical protein
MLSSSLKVTHLESPGTVNAARIHQKEGSATSHAPTEASEGMSPQRDALEYQDTMSVLGTRRISACWPDCFAD